MTEAMNCTQALSIVLILTVFCSDWIGGLEIGEVDQSLIMPQWAMFSACETLTVADD